MVQFHIQGWTTGGGRPPISDQRGQVLRQKYFFGILILLVGSSTITRLIYSQAARKQPSPNVANKPAFLLQDSPNFNIVPDDMPAFDNAHQNAKTPPTELGQINMEEAINPESVPQEDRANHRVNGDDSDGKLELTSTNPEFEGKTTEEDEQLLDTGLTTTSNDDQMSTSPISTASPNPTGEPSGFDVLDGTQAQVVHPNVGNSTYLEKIVRVTSNVLN